MLEFFHYIGRYNAIEHSRYNTRSLGSRLLCCKSSTNPVATVAPHQHIDLSRYLIFYSNEHLPLRHSSPYPQTQRLSDFHTHHGIPVYKHRHQCNAPPQKRMAHHPPRPSGDTGKTIRSPTVRLSSHPPPPPLPHPSVEKPPNSNRDHLSDLKPHVDNGTFTLGGMRTPHSLLFSCSCSWQLTEQAPSSTTIPPRDRRRW